MTDAKEDGQGAWNKCPVWDGSPLTWRAFRREMTWWVSALDLESTKKYNLAARWLLRQSGTVRQRGEEFLPEELEYQREESAVDPDSGETIVLTPEDPLAGLNKLLAALESLNGQSVLDRRGELRTQFYLHLARRPGERVADYASRFRTAVSDLKSEGVKLPDPEVGWFFREKLGLDALRRQLLDTALQGAEAYGTVEAECLRLFRDLHTQDPLYRKMERGANRLTIKKMFAGTASAASSAGGYPAGRRPPGGPSSSSAGSGGLPGPRRYPPRQAQVAEIEPDEFQDEGEAELVADPNGESEERSLEEVLQAEVETLAEEIAAAEEEGVDPAHLEALESGIEASAEALVSMREARTRLAEVRKDRGYKGPAAQAGGGGKGRGRGGASAAISAKKASGKHLCFDCGGSGHWAGDPECPRPGAGAGRAKTRGPKQVRVAEVVPDNELNEVEFKEAPANEVMMLSAGDFGGALRRSLEIGARPVNEALSMTGLAPDKALVGALDSACNRTCAGSAWLEDYVEHLAEAPEYIRDLVKQEPEKESFKFGNGGILPSLSRWRIPAMIANELVCLWVSAVPVDSLGLLLGRDVLDGLQGVLDFGRRTLWCRLFGAYHAPLERLNAGHLALRLIPRSWPADCGKVRFRKVGPDGVLECCLDCREWTKQLLSARHVPTADELDHEDHSHNLTEASLALGKLAFHFGRDPSSMPVALAQSMTFEHCEDHAALVGGRWRRMFLRAVARYDWSREGVRLWLVKQPGLRWLPFPYPSVSSVEQWRLQAAAMVEQRTMPGRWLSKAVFNQQNLASMAWLRSRVGLRFAFLEDPIVAGMMAARSQPGRQARLRTAALREAAEHNASKEDREQVARTLLGPRGGLPTLKADLIKLAALMHVEVAEKDTVEKLKGKLRGIVGALCQRVPYVPPEQVQQARMSPTTARTSTRPSDASQSLPASPVATQGPMATSSGSATPHQPSDLVQVMDQRLLDMDNRYQAMFSQLLTHVMSMQGGPSATTAAGDGMDTEMADDWDQVEAPAEESTVDPRIHSLGVLEAAAKSFRG
ncbi:tenm3 [Symbiodinium sp. KB8]|nr:tenm3 [Symbiodinium sp. KB8]